LKVVCNDLVNIPFVRNSSEDTVQPQNTKPQSQQLQFCTLHCRAIGSVDIVAPEFIPVQWNMLINRSAVGTAHLLMICAEPTALPI